MTGRKTKYQRCLVCKSLVIDAENCVNCAESDPLRPPRRCGSDGKRGAVTLDTIEGNREENF